MIVKKNKKSDFLFFFIIIFFNTTLVLFLFKDFQNLKNDIKIFLFQPEFNVKSFTIKQNIKNFYKIINNKIYNNKNIDKIYIDINFRNLSKIQKDRKKAIENQILRNPNKVKANVVYKGEKYPVKIRLKGDFSEHWSNKKQWSFKIEMLNGEAIMGMNEFSITRHGARQFPKNQIIADLLSENHIYSPRFKTVKLIFNGNDWGPMIIEEQPSKFYAESRKLKNTFFARLGNEDWRVYRDLTKNKISKNNAYGISKYQGVFETDIFNESKVDFTHHKNLLSVIKNFQFLVTNDPTNENIENFIDKKSFAIGLATSLIFGEEHSLSKANARYYINPYTSLIHFIPADHGYATHQNTDLQKISVFLNSLPKFIIYLINNQDFKIYFSQYIKSLNESFVNKIDYNLSKKCIPFGSVCIEQFEIEREKIFKNFIFISKNIDSVINIIRKHNFIKKNDEKITLNNLDYLKVLNKFLYIRAFNNGEVHFYNLLPLNINIDSLTFIKNCKLNSLKSINKKSNIMYDKDFKDCNKEIYKFDKKLIISEKKQKISKLIYLTKLKKIHEYDYLEIKYSIGKNIRSEVVNLEDDFYIKNKTQNYLDNEVSLSGDIKIEKPLLLKNKDLIIDGGSEIILGEESFIHLKNGCLIINNNSHKITKIYFKKRGSNGIFVENCNKETIIENTIFKNLGYFKNKNNSLTGGLNFYKSNLKIDNVHIFDSSGEDAINIVKSKFDINSLKIENSFSDAIDIDFSEGSINNIEINQAGGDGVDFSGSNSSINKAMISNVKDKAVSVGEKTILNLNYLEINKNNIGIATKDESHVVVNDVYSNLNKIEFMVFNKKKIYGKAHMEIKNSNLNKYLLDGDNTLIVNQQKLKETKFNLEDHY